MEALRNRPLFTEVFASPSEFRPRDDSAYIYGLFEERSEHINSWSGTTSNVQAIKVTNQESTVVQTDVPGWETLSLRSSSSIEAFLSSLSAKQIYLDITGLNHHVWAPLVKVAIERRISLKVVYVEPLDYTPNASPRKGEIFDLSERISGISPIPLFTSLAEVEEDNLCFIPLLGFEGARLRYMLEEVEPPGRKIVPIIGVPGFRLEYPFHAYLGNQPVLEETEVWKNSRYARANCPFSLFYVLEDVLKDYPSEHVKIAPIGTKPHALGAVLLAIAAQSRSVELVYDHPKRKPKRTSGVLRLLQYSVSDFFP